MDGWWQRLALDRERLWRIIRLTAFTGTPFVTASLIACGPCPPPEDRLYLVRAPDAEVQALVDLCRRGERPDCQPLCRHLVGNDGGSNSSNVFEHCELHSDREGYLRVHVGWQVSCPGGRRPAGLRLPGSPQEDVDVDVGAWLARLAALEAASVPAFDRLATELVAHGAPEALVRAAAAAAADEVVHARLTAALAGRYGGRAQTPEIPPLDEVRTLDAILAENAAEGCVREAYGAALAARQAVAASDPIVRRAFRRIAEDEARHAALAFSIDHWGQTKLQPAAGRRVRRERVAAADSLQREVEVEPSVAGAARLGLPAPALANAMVTALREQTCRHV